MPRSLGRSLGFLCVSLVGTALLVACGTDRGAAQRAGGHEAGQELPSGFFANPFQGLAARSPEEVVRHLGFDVITPGEIGGSKLVGMNVLAESRDIASAVAWSYRGEDGPFVIIENPNDMTQAGLEAEGSPVPSPGCEPSEGADGETMISCTYGGFSVEKLPWGQPAVVVDGEAVVSVTWLTTLKETPSADGSLAGANLQIAILGPASTLSPKAAMDIVDEAFDPMHPPADASG
jgi:hypothetical protein